MNTSKKVMLPLAVAVAGFLGVAGGSFITSLAANAATNPTTSANIINNDASSQDETVAHHTGSNGVKEELLTGDTAEKVKAAALAAVPGGTIERVENDAEGAAYEAHMKKSDGTRVTVKLDASFKVTNTEDAGPGHRG